MDTLMPENERFNFVFLTFSLQSCHFWKFWAFSRAHEIWKLSISIQLGKNCDPVEKALDQHTPNLKAIIRNGVACCAHRFVLNRLGSLIVISKLALLLLCFYHFLRYNSFCLYSPYTIRFCLIIEMSAIYLAIYKEAITYNLKKGNCYRKYFRYIYIGEVVNVKYF